MEFPTTIKFALILAVIVMILVFMEMFIAREMYRYRYPLPKTFMKIKLKEVEKPIYIYNCNACDSNNICKCKDWEKNGYKKMVIPEHNSSTIKRPLERFKQSAKDIFSGGTPISNLISTIGSGAKIVYTSNPTQILDEQKRKWKILFPENSKIKCFIDENKLYFM